MGNSGWQDNSSWKDSGWQDNNSGWKNNQQDQATSRSYEPPSPASQVMTLGASLGVPPVQTDDRVVFGKAEPSKSAREIVMEERAKREAKAKEKAAMQAELDKLKCHLHKK